jgi:hypothetical protein
MIPLGPDGLKNLSACLKRFLSSHFGICRMQE